MYTFSGWSRSCVYGYGLLDSVITNTKYIITEKDCNWVNLPEKYYKYYLEGYSYVKIDEFICNLLNEFGFKFDDEYVYEFLINHSDKQYKLPKLVTINENIVDRLYQYKFELLKN